LLLLTVFVIGAGIGALIIALSHHTDGEQLIVKRVARTPPPVPAITTTTRRAPVSRPALKRTQSTDASTVPAGAAESFAALQSTLLGSVGLAVAPLGSGSIKTFGQVQVARAWSTSKVPVIVTLLYTNETSRRTLSPSGRSYVTLALEQSDNAAIEALFSELEQLKGGLVPASAAVQQMLRNAGDETTTINTAPNNDGFTTYGQSDWSLTGEVTFYRALARGCLLDPSDTSYVLGLMHDVISSQRWGAGSAGYPSGVSLAFKGGWGPQNGDYQVRQTAIVGSGNHGYVFSMLALPSSGSFADGTSMITALATWARQHLVFDASTPSGQCS
jgi:hypothetical protein